MSETLFDSGTPFDGGTPDGARGAAELPVPTTERFQLLRAGIVNLWQYDHQELRFHQGRLLLRGDNGSGKSKALEVLLPFLLDADLAPNRLDPFGGTSRTMRWNLLMDGRWESRVGYVWLELGRLPSEYDKAPAAGEPMDGKGGDGATAVYWTLGCGLQARQRVSGPPTSWYFLTPRRIGRDLDLLLPGGTPRLRKQLGEALGDEGRLFDTGRDYRQALDRHLFGFGSEDRFANLRHLLLQLRRPQLSEKLDPDKLSELLTESLPPLDGDLIGQLSEGFERLDNDQKELARVEAAEGQVRSFLEVYRDYGRGIARERAREVRQADSRYHKTAAEVRGAEAEGEEVAGKLGELEERRRACRREADELEGRVRALERSEAMRSAEALEIQGRRATERERQAQQDRRDAEAAGAEVEDHRRALGEAERETAEAGATRDRRARQAEERARDAGTEALHAAAVESLDEQPEAAQATVRTALEERRGALEEIEERVRERDEAHRSHERAEDRRRDSEAGVDAALERRRRAAREVEREREALEEELRSWWQGLAELHLGEEEFEVLRTRIAGRAPGEPEGEPDGAPEGRPEEAGADAGTEGNLTTAVEALARPLREARIREDQRLAAEAEATGAERADVEAERARVEAAEEVPPEPPRTREADREGRPGAPFYRLLDFAEGLSPERQAGLEAALEGAGLLDAWVTPEGKLLDAGSSEPVLDTALAPTPRDHPGTLAEVLVPAVPEPPSSGEKPRSEGPPSSEGQAGVHGDVHGGVHREVVVALLHSIDLTDYRDGAPTPSPGTHTVGPDGRWRLGPLRGAWSKPEARHIGAAAREAARRRRLEELEERLREISDRIEELSRRRREVAERLEALEREVASVPQEAPLRRATRDAAAAAEDLRRRRAELAEAETAAAQAREAWEAAVRKLEEQARASGLGPYLDNLPGYRRRLDAWEGAFRELFHAAVAALKARRQEERARSLFEAARDRHLEAERRAEARTAEAARLRAQVDELEATVGAEAREVMERLERTEEALEARRRDQERLDGEWQEARERQVELRTELRLKSEELEARDAERGRALHGLRRLGETGFLALVLDQIRGLEEAEGEARSEAEAEGVRESDDGGGDRIPSAADPDAWSFTRALELAREIERLCSGVDLSPEARDRRADRLYQRFHTFAADLGADFEPSLHREEDLELVRVTYNGRAHDLPGLAAALAEGIQTRRSLLADHERELLQRFLLGEVGDHLRDRLRAGRGLVDEMNRLLEDCPTASGMVLKLSWKPAPDGMPNGAGGTDTASVRRAVERLLQDPYLLSEADRRGLEGFFRRRIEQARQRWEAVPWREHLLRALDYRSWFAFTVLRRTGADESWTPMTRRDHAASSGGEKAVALHLPLFAAAAAHYGSARGTAPRLVLLDEAFAGIDQGMRGRCMGLLVQFDLDFMMTSHDEWGCYEELPGLATYQLYRDPEIEGVAAVRFVWDGRRLEERPAAPKTTATSASSGVSPA